MTPSRHLVVVLLSLAAFCAYLTRVCVSTAATTIQSELHLTNERMGGLFAAFSLGYFLFQAPAGWLGNRFGNRLVLSALSIAWSLCTLWSGLAHSAASLWSARLGVGLSQAGLVPCSSKVVYDWIPPAGRGSASAILTCAMSIGAVLASGLTALLLPVIGWRAVFALYSMVGVVWAIVFFALFRDRPSAARDTASSPFPIAAMLASPSLWTICGQSFFRAFSYAFFVTWFPAYLEKAHGLRVVEAGLFAMMPLAGAVAGSLAGGFLIDLVLRRTGSRRLSRSATAAVALLLSALATLAAAFARTPTEAVLVIACGSFFLGVSGPCAWAATMDIGASHTALVFAIMNMAGVAGDMASPVSVGYIFSYVEKSAGNWNLILFLFAAIGAAGAICWAALNPDRPVVKE